jgi:hypothetical protein
MEQRGLKGSEEMDLFYTIGFISKIRLLELSSGVHK